MKTQTLPRTLPRNTHLLLRCMLVAVLTLALSLPVIPVNLQSAYAEPTSAEKQAEVDEASARLVATETEMMQIGEDYQVALAAHDNAMDAMEDAQARVDAAQAIISDTQDRLGARAVYMYRQGPLSFLAVLFGATSFEEFTTSWDLINAINIENAQLIQANKDAREEAQTAREEFAEQEKVAAQNLAEIEALKNHAEELYTAQEAELACLSEEVADLVLKEQQQRQAETAVSNPAAYGDYDAPAVPSGGYNDVVAAAGSRIGCPYVYGAAGPEWFDCSGFTSWCYMQAGRGFIGRAPAAQYANASARWRYADGGAEPGDVLWWPPETGYNHVAIYAGGGSYIHASFPGGTVCYSSWDINSLIVLRF